MAHEATIHGIGVGVGEGGVGAPVVLLEARGEIVPIFVDPGQAQTIELAQQELPAERPLTHDLFVDLLHDVDAMLDRVRIDDLRDETFYAKLDLAVERGDEQKQIVRDARPSDGIALAVRVDCPITIDDAVIDKAGQDLDQLGVGTAEFRSSSLEGRGLGGQETHRGESEAADEIDHDASVDIDIDEPADADDDTDPES
ncbi:bifunctional nuclease family protein [Haloarcula sp. JP-L23]|uniref:bifunctional nuclease family protein n=1 Tax=Haloarcula sp. JP-L23 TaxID=2716717 RepID=UPI00140F2238|nr:bifunctional nuclease family protein [Haloarcula sp. JP-L23]